MPAPEPVKMTVAELTEAVAVKVMGWTRRSSNETSQGWTWAERTGRFAEYASWNPKRDANHRDMIVDQMQELGFYYECKMMPPAPRVFVEIRFCGYDAKGWTIGGCASHTEKGTAVMLAAHEAKTGQRVELIEQKENDNAKL